VYTVLLKNRKNKEFSSSFYTVFIIASIVVIDDSKINTLLFLGLLLVGFQSTQRPRWPSTSATFYIKLDPSNWSRNFNLVLFIGLLYVCRYADHSFGVIQSLCHYSFFKW
jgi:hypothetical protein